MKEKVISILSELTKLEKKELLENMDTVKMWDSMKHIEIILAIEEAYGIMFEQEELSELVTITEIIRVLQRKVG